MLLNAVTLELVNLIKEQSRGFTVLPLTVDPNTQDHSIGASYRHRPLDNDMTSGTGRFICYHIVPGSTSYINYFLDHAQPNRNTWMLIKRQGYNHRVIQLRITDHTKIRIAYWRGYGWGHNDDRTSSYSTNRPRSDEAKEHGKHIIVLKPIYKAHRSHKRWHSSIDKLDLTMRDYTPVAQIIIQTIIHSHCTTGLPNTIREIDMDAMALADTGRVFLVDDRFAPLS